jgi:hypothetical protein
VGGAVQPGLIGVVGGGVGGEVGGGVVTTLGGSKQPTPNVRNKMRIRGIIRYFIFILFIAFQL